MSETTTPPPVAPAQQRVEQFCSFIAHSPSAVHAADTIRRRLVAAGYSQHDAAGSFPAEPGGHVTCRGGSAIAWWVPKNVTSTTRLRVIGCHTDSPGFVLKPNGDIDEHGFSVANCEIYGGPILASWFDRPLEFAGEIITDDGRRHLVRTGPIARIPHLAIHLDRSVNDSFSVDKQTHMRAIVGHAGGGGVIGAAARAAGVAVQSIIAHQLITVCADAPSTWGVAGEFVSTGRLDNLSSVEPAVAAMESLTAATPHSPTQGTQTTDIVIMAAFDHEEVGSMSRNGACGPLLDDVITGLCAHLGFGADERRKLVARSIAVSCDAAHSVHPNYPSRHDPQHLPVAGDGAAVKMNASQRYATDAAGHAMVAALARRHGIKHQVFVSNNSLPCGTTIGPLSAARTGIHTVDIGMPILSMHSAQETCAASDIGHVTALLTAFAHEPQLPVVNATLT